MLVQGMVKCRSCGSDNPCHVAFCGRCGEPLESRLKGDEARKASAEGVPRQEPEADFVPMRKCNWCGTLNGLDAGRCAACGKDPRGQPKAEETQLTISVEPKSRLPVAGGILSIIAGVLGIAQGLVLLATQSVIEDVMGYAPPDASVCSVLSLLFGLVGLAGGVFAVQYRNFGLSFVGAILGMLSIGFGLSLVWGMISVVLIAVSKDDF